MNIGTPKSAGTRVFLICLAALLQPSLAWKVGTHVATGNQVLDDFAANGRTPLNLSAGTTVEFKDPLTGRVLSIGVTQKDALQAIKLWPEYFRAGLIGPDGFPDMVTGQMVEHANEAPFIWEGLDLIKSSSPSSIKPSWANYQVPDALLASAPLEARSTPSQFRSIDFAMSMLKEAKEYVAPVTVNTTGGWIGVAFSGVGNTAFGVAKPVTKSVSDEEQQQILAFVIGYIGHCIGDGMGHTYINEYASGAWDYLEGEGLFGAESEEIKHVVTEGFIDKRIPGALRNSDGIAGKQENRYTIAIPLKFLDRFFSTRHASQDVGDRNGSPEKFLAAYSDIDQYYGGPFYSYFNMQVDAGDHIEDWANARGFLNVVDKLDPLVSFLGAVDDIVEGVPGMEQIGEFKNWAKGDLLQSLTFGKLNCESPQNVDFFDIWKRLSSIRGNISKWKDHSTIVRQNWLMMSRCTAENLAKINGGKNPGVGHGNVTYTDACAEMAREKWADQSGASINSLTRGSIRVEAPATKQNGETADQEFLRETKEAFLGEGVNGLTFEEANKHRLAAANIERAYGYLLGVSITIDDLMEIFSVGSLQPTMDYYCGMADPVTQKDKAHRDCFNVSKRGELLLVLEAFCLYEAGKDAVKCVTDMKKTWDDCKRKGDRMCENSPLAEIPVPRICAPRICKKIWRKKFCIGGGCIGGGSITNYPWLGICYAGVIGLCAEYDVLKASVCELSTVGAFTGCSLNAINDAVFKWDPFKDYFRTLDQGCDALVEVKKDIAIYEQFDTPQEREAFLRRKGVPVDQINELKQVWASVMDKLVGLPDTYMLNLVFLKEDLRDPQYVEIVRSALLAAKSRIQNANESDRVEALAVVGELEVLVEDMAANRNAFYMPYDPADLSTSIDGLPASPSKNQLQTRVQDMMTLVQVARSNPRDIGLVARIDAQVSLLNSIEFDQVGAFNREGYEQRDAIIQTMTSLRLFVENSNTGFSFNNYPLLKTSFSNLISSGVKGAGYAARGLDIVLKYAVIPEIAGPTAQRIIAQMGSDLPITFTPFYNTVQGVKVDAVISPSDWSNLFVKYGLSTQMLPWNKPKSNIGSRALYSEICQDPAMSAWGAVSIYCDVLKSNDDPNCYGCTARAFDNRGDKSWKDYLAGNIQNEKVTSANFWDWTRGVYAWGGNGVEPTTFTNFPLSADQTTYSTLYSNIFRNPTCGGALAAMPTSKEVVLGSPLTLQASLSEAATILVYIWVKDGVEIAGGPNPIYTKSSFQPSDIGEYWVVAVTSCGTRLVSGHTLVTRKALDSVYVDGTSANGGDGSNWASALRSLDEGIQAAAANATIFLAQGTYQPPAAKGTFTLGAGMRLLGGFSNGGNVRNPALYQTILSGSTLKPLVTVENAGAELNGLVLGAGSPSAAVAAGIQFATPMTASSLVIRNVRFVGQYSSASWGTVVSFDARGLASRMELDSVSFESSHVPSSVVSVLSGGSVSMNNTRFEGNVGGPLLTVTSGDVSLRNVLMVANDCESSLGGVMQISGTATANFLTITGNTDPSGVTSPKPSITGSGSVNIRNSIVWDDLSSMASSAPATFTTSVAKGISSATEVLLDGSWRPMTSSPAKGLADQSEAGTFDLAGNVRPAYPDAGALQGQ